MSDAAKQDRERLLELLSDRALFGLDSQEEQELAKLQQAYPDVDDQEMDRVVALLEAASPAGVADEMPKSVRQQVLASSDSGDTPPTATSPKNSAGRIARDLFVAALAIAATLLIVVVSQSPVGSNSASDLAQLQRERTQFVESATDLVQVAWSPTDETKKYAGDVVWSSQSQRGFMTFRGLPVNDVTKEQYQLWIFDKNQDERYPVDGGVFDVVGDEVIVEIDSKIAVVDPTMFAITVEKPGGVVVSDRSRLPLLAMVN